MKEENQLSVEVAEADETRRMLFVPFPSVKVGCISEIIEKKLNFSLYFAQFALPLQAH